MSHSRPEVTGCLPSFEPWSGGTGHRFIIRGMTDENAFLRAKQGKSFNAKNTSCQPESCLFQ